MFSLLSRNSRMRLKVGVKYRVDPQPRSGSIIIRTKCNRLEFKSTEIIYTPVITEC